MIESRPQQARPAIFLDRDGTIVKDYGYMSGKSPIDLIPGILRLMKEACTRSVPIYIVTNQSGISRGLFSTEEMHIYNKRLVDYLSGHKIKIGGIAHCPHHPADGCTCRKPMPGMLHELKRLHNISLENSVMRGDKDSDKALGDLHCLRGFKITAGRMTYSQIEEILANFKVKDNIIQ